MNKPLQPLHSRADLGGTSSTSPKEQVRNPKPEIRGEAWDSRSSSLQAGVEGGLPRRDFLKQATLGSLSLAILGRATRRTLAGDGEVHLAPDHLIPVDKQLDPAWVRSLFAKGEPEWFAGSDLETIGMPVGGICAGQVYLTGDGRLAYWDIFNQNNNTGYGAVNWKEGRSPYEKVESFKLVYDAEVRQGFAVQVRQADGSTAARTLDRPGFAKLRFRGEYPIGRVEYADPAFPVQVSLEAFSPFIPLNARDSSLPATILNYTLKNTGNTAVEVTLAGWLSNAVCRHSAVNFAGRFERTASAVRERGLTGVSLAARATAREQAVKPPTVFADFESGDYGDWKSEGEAFGAKPAGGTLDGQQAVSGFAGKGLVNTFLGGDKPHGRLTSPEFTIERSYISFLIGGGSQQSQTCMNLVVDGKVARTATGKDNERLDPHNWDVSDLRGKPARLEIVDNASGGWGHVNIDQIEFRDDPMSGAPGELTEQADFGTMGLYALTDEGAGSALHVPPATDLGAFFKAADEPSALRQDALVRVTRSLQPGEEVTLPFVVAWNFPNMYRGAKRVGNRYADDFHDARDVARYIRDEFDRLCADTRAWRDTYYASTLPLWLLDRVHSTASNLATTTAQWWRSGRFWAWEGCGCCHGTCGHVWNYAQTLARLFPELERSVREHQDFKLGIGLHEDGSIGFRGEGWNLWAGDSQGGYVLKAYREHQCSADDAFLRRNWPAIKQAVQFLIKQDANADGLIEGSQHQTYDENYFGANTFVGSMYLGALRAAEQMAVEMGDEAFARRCHDIFESGSKLSVIRLFNGQYFVQEVDLKQHPDWQYGDGCLADQLFGQTWAHQLGLGYLYPDSKVRTALDSVWKYCWAPDLTAQNEAHPPERWFASKGDAGLFTCTWPLSKHMGPKSTRYRDELWTGIEYQVASNMASEGMLTEALAICRAIHDRYHPRRYNPYNEIECGDHYARAMASWGMLIGLSGFEYHGPLGHLGFVPRITPDDFQCAFTGAEGWGTLSQSRKDGTQTNRIGVNWGTLRVQSLAIETENPGDLKQLHLRVGEGGIEGKAARQGRRCVIALSEPVVLKTGEALEIEVS
ncbi:MAG: hypothetical protein H7A46_10725 [Verrucomicrobiales bacterium]|nr:hypothetical protein [Verrucomicrobiales bacterium]